MPALSVDGKESTMKNKKLEYAAEIYSRLEGQHPNAHCELNHSNPFELLIATILSAQCTDVRVNMVTPLLFKHYPTPDKLAQAIQEDVENIIHSTGFYKNKAKNIIACSQQIVLNHQGKIPQDIVALSSLAGVGRKTANVVLSNAFNINHGVVVDTHVKRITKLLKLTKNDNPELIEKDLMRLFPQDQWGQLSHLIIFHGRRTCIARRPQCDLCCLVDICPSAKKSR
jgi:endonuclease III